MELKCFNTIIQHPREIWLLSYPSIHPDLLSEFILGWEPKVAKRRESIMARLVIILKAVMTNASTTAITASSLSICWRPLT